TVLAFETWPYDTKPVVVLTTNPSMPKPPAGAVCDFMTGTPVEIVARLSARGMTHLYVDGGITIQGFLEAGLIQRVIITRIPVLLGSGSPLFGSLSHDIGLEHLATRSFASGMVQSQYVVCGCVRVTGCHTPFVTPVRPYTG